MIKNGSYEIVSTVDTDSNDTLDKDYYVKIVNKRITRIGAIIKETKYSYCFYSLDCKGVTEKTAHKIMDFINEKYPKFYKIVQKKVNNLA
jgi:hypothetical protein